ncbi:hypothetical protein JOD43_003232 [Pullulanibacillus pueri]|uniref:hypothetical protein n=1 Tax=Pullulanibacillus pueri TaxID=1437324 RepID=UPI00166EE62D|nr:hypothetical protein [Pullulanibacillus pueri]MBM7683053.1 hypothetical protein [Pullulanibacillus pueri]
MRRKNRRSFFTLGCILALGCLFIITCILIPGTSKEHLNKDVQPIASKMPKRTFIEKPSINAPSTNEQTKSSIPEGGVQELPNTRLSDPVILSRLPYTHYEKSPQTNKDPR